MSMIKKIALLTSFSFFILTQLFSFVIITRTQHEKIEIVAEEEGERFNLVVSESEQLITGKEDLSKQVLQYIFRNNLLDNTAVYNGENSIFNNSSYDFHRNDTKEESESSDFYEYKEITIEGRRMILFEAGLFLHKQAYQVYHLLDITDIYHQSIVLMIEEISISFVIAAMITIFLVLSIQRITRPLEETNQMQLQLIGSLSHELKTPLTEEQRQKAIKYIYREGNRMSRLSDKMTELTKLYKTESGIVFETVDINRLYQDVKALLAQKMQEKKITLAINIPKENLTMNLDRDLMMSFLTNLINNSIMASKPDSVIELGANENSLWVRDEGSGIPREEISRIRTPFYRIDKSRSGKSGNMGLGLALCEQIAKLHHAEMRIESMVGEGTKISLQFAYKSVKI